jgi:hypothetical protein
LAKDDDTVIAVQRLKDMRVQRSRVVLRSLPIMESNHPPHSPKDATAAFEHELQDLVLTAFGHGAAVEGTWEITAPATDAPNWDVKIEKHPADNRSFEPTALEE